MMIVYDARQAINRTCHHGLPSSPAFGRFGRRLYDLGTVDAEARSLESAVTEMSKRAQRHALDCKKFLGLDVAVILALVAPRHGGGAARTCVAAYEVTL